MQKIGILYLALFAYLIIPSSSAPPGGELEVKKISDADAQAQVVDLTKYVEKLQVEHFEGDAVLEQYVDKLNEFTTYKLHGAGKRGPNIYERKASDFEKEAIVFPPSEDHILSHIEEKRVYVGLRRAGDDDNKYYAIFIYLREPQEGETGAVSVGGKERIIELDSWIDRNDKERSSARSFGWDECSSSIFVPCKSTQTSGLATHRPALPGQHPASPGKKAAKKQSKEEVYKAEAGEPGENVDYFWDMEDDIQQGRFIEAITGAVGGLLAPVTGLLGGALAPVTGILNQVPLVGPLVGGLLGSVTGALGGGGGGGGGGLLGGLLGGGGGAPGGGGGLLGGLLGGGGDPAAGGAPGAAPAGGGGLLGGLLGGKRRKRALNSPPTEMDINNARAIHLAVLTAVSQKLDSLLGEKLMKTDLHSYPGWLTMDHGGQPGDVSTHESDAFVGFGVCEYKRVTEEDYEKAKTPEQVIVVLATALRTNCVRREVSFFHELLTDGYLKLNDDKTFDVLPENKYVKRDKLSPRRRGELSRALELSVFSKAFKEELFEKTPTVVKAFDSTLSRRIHVFTQTILNGIKEATSTLRQHEIKLLRSLALTVKTAFMKLLQDYESTKDCSTCKEDQEIIHADRMQLMGLLKFIIHGLGELEKPPASYAKAFATFLETNEKAIHESIQNYE